MFETNNLYGFLPIYPSNKEDLTIDDLRETCITTAVFGCAGYYMVVLATVLLCALFSACGSSRTIHEVQLRDSIRTEVITNTVVVTDTQYVKLPAQIIERATPDTTSTIRTSFAESTAAIRDGLLYHSIRNLETPVPVPVQHKETTRDSIVYREKEIPVPVPVVKEVERQLSAWQQVRLWLGNLVFITIGITTFAWIIKKRAWWLRLLRLIK